MWLSSLDKCSAPYGTSEESLKIVNSYAALRVKARFSDGFRQLAPQVSLRCHMVFISYLFGIGLIVSKRGTFSRSNDTNRR